MYCNVFNEIKNYFLENISGISAFILSLLSLKVSWMAYKRDDPKLDLNLYAAELMGGQNWKVEEKGLAVSVANIGKNSVKLDSLGGYSKYYKFKIFIFRFLKSYTPKFLSPTAFLIDAVEINQNLRPQGFFITLAAGDRITFIIPNPRGHELGKHLSKKASCVHIFDAIGNRYEFSKPRFAKLKSDYSDSKK